MSIFARRFKHLRENVMHWTQDDAAEHLGVSRSTIAGYESESKARIPREDMLRKIADEFRVSVDYLLGRDMNDAVMLPVGEVVQIPIVAEIPCGMPAVTEDNVIGHFPVDSSQTNLNGADWVFVKAKGDSMIGVGIRDGSLVLLRLQPEVEDRDIAAVCIDNERATLKRVFFAGGQVILMPENPTMSPFTYDRDRVRIVGKAIKVINDL